MFDKIEKEMSDTVKLLRSYASGGWTDETIRETANIAIQRLTNAIADINRTRTKHNKFINLLKRIDHDIFFDEDLGEFLIEIRQLGVYEVEDFS